MEIKAEVCTFRHFFNHNVQGETEDSSGGNGMY